MLAEWFMRIRIFSCPLCGLESNRRANIQVHLKTKHNGETTLTAALKIATDDYEKLIQDTVASCFPTRPASKTGEIFV